jgi:hypothetical protein
VDAGGMVVDHLWKVDVVTPALARAEAKAEPST